MSHSLPSVHFTARRSFADLLNYHLEQSGINATDLASKLDLKPETLNRWLSGKVKRPRQRADVLRCATYLGLNAEQRSELLSTAGFTAVPAHRLPMSASSDLPLSLSPTLQRSPFIVGPPVTEPHQFFGREYLLKRIFAIWHSTPLQHIAIVGAKRSGKTSLLHYLRHIVDTPNEALRPQQQQKQQYWRELMGYQWAFIDFQDPRMCYQESLLRHILYSLNMPIPEPCDLIGFMEILDQYLEIPTFLLLDEINVGLNAPDLDEQFWWGLRSIGSNHAGGKIGFVLTSQKNPEELLYDDNKPSPFFNIFGHVFNLEPFDADEIKEMLENTPLPFSEADYAWLIAHTRGWPALLQIAGQARLTALNEKQCDAAWQEEALKRMKPYQYLLQS